MHAYPSGSYAWYVVLVLLLVGMTSYLDRYIISLLIEPIKADLNLSDTRVSFLQGTAFAIFFVAFGLPCGAIVDHANRRTMLAIGIAIWSVMTAAGGLAETYWQLFAARAGVGIGEACLAPAAFSLIADYFPLHRRGRAMSVYNMANYMGGGASLLIGGLVLTMLGGAGAATLPLFGSIASWKATFIIVGAPGILLSLLMLTVREPARQQMIKVADRPIDGFIRHMQRAPSVYASVHLVSAATAFVGFGVASWIATYFVRKFGLAPSHAGIIVGPVSAGCGMIGCILSGIVSDRMVSKDVVGGRFVLPLIWYPLALVGLVIVVTAHTLAPALAGIGVFMLGSGFGLASVAPTIHDITPNQFRGRATSLHFVLAGLLALGSAPTLIALVNDHLFGRKDALGASMLMVMGPIILISFTTCLLMRRRYDIVRRRYLPDALEVAAAGGDTDPAARAART